VCLFLVVFSRCPDDPEKTVISLVAHANPGAGVPKWAAKTAVNALAATEPFRLFHKINENVKRNQPQLRERLQQAEMVSTLPGGRSPRPAGIAQLGYSCFWPNGGGSIEGGGSEKSPTPESNHEQGPGVEQGTEGGNTQMEDSDSTEDDLSESS
jgi:hypothetical protein